MQLNVSTTFFPAALLPGFETVTSDIAIFTSDLVAFYCHTPVLKTKSSNDFGSLLRPSPRRLSVPLNFSAIGVPLPSGLPNSETLGVLTTVMVTENSVVFNIILHLVYPGLSLSRYAPDMGIITEALQALPKYGIPTPDDSSNVWTILLAYAPEHPLHVYGVGAACASDLVCAAASPLTLGTSLGWISEADAVTIGAVYLRRLALLHAERVAALKRIITRPPDDHSDCPPRLQGTLSLSWKEGVAEVLLQSQPQNTDMATLITTFGPLASTSDCPRCKENATARINTICREWSSVPRTI